MHLNIPPCTFPPNLKFSFNTYNKYNKTLFLESKTTHINIISYLCPYYAFHFFAKVLHFSIICNRLLHYVVILQPNYQAIS